MWRPAIGDTVGVQFLPGYKGEAPIDGATLAWVDRILAAHASMKMTQQHDDVRRRGIESLRDLIREQAAQENALRADEQEFVENALRADEQEARRGS